MKVYRVYTHGGQITDEQTPEELEVPENLVNIVMQNFARFGGFWFTDSANYYDTFKHAQNAIKWALRN